MPSLAYARDVAAEALSLLGPDRLRLAVPVFALARLLGVQVQPWPFSKIVGGLFRGDDGPVIVFNRVLPGQRARLVVAHELGHYLLHGRSRSYFKCADDDKTRAEREANSFAFALLLPPDQVRVFWRPYRKAADMAVAFNVTEEMATLRLRLMGPIQKGQSEVRW